MKLQAEISEKKIDIEVKREGDIVFANVDGREYDLKVSQPERDVYLFKKDGRIVEAFVSPQIKQGEPHQVQIGGDAFEIRLIDPKRLRGSGADADHAGGAAEIKTAMPGKVVRILLAAGAEVEKGDGVLVVEAMKMQNELKSPKAGKIKDIKVQEGETVAAGDILAIIE